MCAPALPVLALAMSAIGTGFSALQANQQAKYQSKVADRNADLANEAAAQEQANTRQEALAFYRRQAQLKGSQRAAMSANGIDVNFGSAADIQADTEMLGREDVRRLYDQGAQKARGFEIEASNFGAEANAQRHAATGALIKGGLDIGSTALDGAQQFGSVKKKVSTSSSQPNYGYRVGHG